MTSPAKLSYIAKLVCVDSILFGNDYQTSQDIQNLVDNAKNIPSSIKEAWPENLSCQGAEHSVTLSQGEERKAVIPTQKEGLDFDTHNTEVEPIDGFQPKEAGLTGSNSLEEYLTQLLETGFFTAVSEDILIRLVEHYPFRLTNRLLLALLPPYARELNLFNCTERLTLMGLVEGLKKCNHLQRLNLQNCSQLLHSDLFTLMGLMNNHLSTLILEGNSNVTDEIVQTAILSLPNLTSLNISCCGSITDDVFLLDPVLQLKRETSQKPVEGDYSYRLSYVDISGVSSISSVAIRHLASLCGPNLQQLNLAWSTQVDSTALFYLAGYNFPTIVDLVLGRQSELTQERELKEYITELREIKELYLMKDKDHRDDPTKDSTTENTKAVVEEDNLEPYASKFDGNIDTGQSLKLNQEASTRMDDSVLCTASLDNVDVMVAPKNIVCPDSISEKDKDLDMKISITLNNSEDSCCKIRHKFGVIDFRDELTNSALDLAKTISEVIAEDEKDLEHDNSEENKTNKEITNDFCDNALMKYLNPSKEIDNETDDKIENSSSCDSVDMKKVAMETHDYEKDSIKISTQIQNQFELNSRKPQICDEESQIDIEKQLDDYIQDNQDLSKNSDNDYPDEKTDFKSDIKDQGHEVTVSNMCDTFEYKQHGVEQANNANNVMTPNKSVIKESLVLSLAESADCEIDLSKEEDQHGVKQVNNANNVMTPSNSVIKESLVLSETESLNSDNGLSEAIDSLKVFSETREVRKERVLSSVDSPMEGATNTSSITHKSVHEKPTNNNNNSEKENLGGQEVFKPGLISLDITNIKFVNRKLGQLCLRTFLDKNPGLQKLELSWKGLTEEFLRDVLPNLNKLAEVSLEECTFIQNGGLAALLRHCQSLRSINLRGVVFIKDMAMTPMYTMSNLTKINLAESEISDTTLFRIGNRLNEKLTELDLSWCEGITEKGVNYVCMKCTQLQSMVLRSCPVSNITLHVMSQNCPNMRELLIDSVEGVSSNEFSDTGLLDVAENMFQLEILDISWNLSITNLAISSLMNNLSRLKEVHMKGLKQITCLPFLPIVSGVRDDNGMVKEFWVDEYCNNLQTASCLRRSTVFAPNLRILDLEYSDLVEDKRLELIVKVCRGSLEVTDYYGRHLVPDESSNLVISTAGCRI